MARVIRSLASAETFSGLRNARETVIGLTFAATATSERVVFRDFSIIWQITRFRGEEKRLDG